MSATAARETITIRALGATARKRPGGRVELRCGDARGRQYRPDRQVHVDQDGASLERAALSIYQTWRSWLEDHPTARYWGQTHGKWVVRATLDRDSGRGMWFTLGLLPPMSVLPPLDRLDLAERPDDPCDIPAAWTAVVADPEVTLEGRLHLLEILDLMVVQGFASAGVIEGATAADTASNRPKTTVYLQGHQSGWVAVVEVFWGRDIVFPPYGLPTEPAELPALHAKQIRRAALPEKKDTDQLKLWEDERTPVPQAARTVRDADSLEAELVATMEEVMRARPYICVTYSGGKDSTTALHGALRAAERLAAQGSCPPVHILSSDTKVENPALASHVRQTFAAIRDWAATKNLPVFPEIVEPAAERSFWVQVIGRGYTPPNRLARWCTRTLKLEPNATYAAQLAERYPGERGVLVLGSRDDESAQRAASNARHAQGGDMLWTASGIPHLDAATPIRTWLTDEVFAFLSEAQAPWGKDYNDLLRLYRHSTGECPVAISHVGEDKERSTQTLFQSCGSQPGRMGCWTCSVVNRDTSLERLSQERGGIYDGHLRVREILVAAGNPRWGLRSGWQRTREVMLWQQGYGELDGTASAWLLHALAEEDLWLSAEECMAIVDAWRDREIRGEVRIPDLGWAALARHRNHTAGPKIETGSADVD